jgi:flagellar hook-basal body complex protein FliE
MVMPIRPGDAFAPAKLDIAPVAAKSEGPSLIAPENSFTEKLREAVQGVNELPQQGEKVAADYADGKQNDLHGTMVSMAQADISLRMVANVRNRAIEAYREIMRMGS